MSFINVKDEIKDIEYTSIFRSIKDPYYNSCIIIGRNLKDKPILVYIEKMENTLILNKETNFTMEDKLPTFSNFILQNQILVAKDGSIVRIVDLSFEKEFEKEMTKEEIEKELGYKIKII